MHFYEKGLALPGYTRRFTSLFWLRGSVIRERGVEFLAPVLVIEAVAIETVFSEMKADCKCI